MVTLVEFVDLWPSLLTPVKNAHSLSLLRPAPALNHRGGSALVWSSQQNVSGSLYGQRVKSPKLHWNTFSPKPQVVWSHAGSFVLSTPSWCLLVVRNNPFCWYQGCCWRVRSVLPPTPWYQLGSMDHVETSQLLQRLFQRISILRHQMIVDPPVFPSVPPLRVDNYWVDFYKRLQIDRLHQKMNPDDCKKLSGIWMMCLSRAQEDDHHNSCSHTRAFGTPHVQKTNTQIQWVSGKQLTN